MRALLFCFFLTLAASASALNAPDWRAHRGIPVVQREGQAERDKYPGGPVSIICTAPGDTLGQTTYDWWSFGAPKRTIALPSPYHWGCIYLQWTYSNEPEPWPDMHARCNMGTYPGQPDWLFGVGMNGGMSINGVFRSFSGSVDQNSSSLPFMSFERYMPSDYISSLGSDIVPCLGAIATIACSSAVPDTVLWPDVSIDSDDVVHVFGASTRRLKRLYYSRSPDLGYQLTAWSELDTLGFGWHSSVASKLSLTVAVLYSVCGDSSWQPADRNNSLVILESFDSGENFTRRTVLKSLLDPSDTLNCMQWSGSGLYDREDSIHVVTVAAKPAGPGLNDPLSACNLWHYTPEYGLHLVSSYPWMYEPPAFNGTDGVYGNNQLIHMPSIGEDTATGCLYVLWSEFPWYEEGGGFQCGELFVSRSTDDGQTWSFKMDMTNSRNESEVYPSLARVVDGNLHVLYESDLVAGAYVLGNSALSHNPVRYLKYRLADGNAAALTIDSPSDTMTFGEPCVPVVTVENRSGHPISFSVSCQADYGDYCFYMDTKPVEELAPNVPTQILFEPWIPDSAILGLSGTFWACAGYVGDTDYSDDCVEKAVVVGTEEIISADKAIRRFTLGQSYPNPFNRSTAIAYTIPSRGRALLAVHDLAGRIVKILVDSELPAGAYTATWDGKDARGKEVGSGVYFYSLHAGSFSDTKKMILFR